MNTTGIKTITFLMKCLRVDIPIYKEVLGVHLQVNRIVLYKTSLIELMHMMQAGTLFLKVSRAHADAYIKEVTEAEKSYREQVELDEFIKKHTATATQEPGYELCLEDLAQVML